MYIKIMRTAFLCKARLQQLLPRLAARLAAERRMLVEMQRQEGQQCLVPQNVSSLELPLAQNTRKGGMLSML